MQSHGERVDKQCGMVVIVVVVVVVIVFVADAVTRRRRRTVSRQLQDEAPLPLAQVARFAMCVCVRARACWRLVDTAPDLLVRATRVASSSTVSGGARVTRASSPALE